MLIASELAALESNMALTGGIIIMVSASFSVGARATSCVGAGFKRASRLTTFRIILRRGPIIMITIDRLQTILSQFLG